MTRYRVPVADPLLEEDQFWTSVEGFRLISVDGPWLARPDEVTICTFEDDNAPAELEGKLVELTFTRVGSDAPFISDRRVIGGA